MFKKMNATQHKCSKCNESFDPKKARTKDMSWTSLFSRPAKPLPLGDDIEAFNVVKCPYCGYSERASELKVFGIFPGGRIKLVLGALLVIVLVFGYWIIKQ